MTFRVVCPNCLQVSELDDEALDARAVCPFCSDVFDVSESIKMLEPDLLNSAVRNRNLDSLDAITIEWGQIDPRTCCRIAAELYRCHARPLLIAHGLVLSCSWLLEILARIAPTALSGILQPGAMLIAFYLNIGLTLFALKIARRHTADLNLIFSGGSRLFRYVLYHLLLIALVLLGCLGFVVPGVYFGSRFWAGGLFIVDQNCGVMEAFGLSSRFSEGNRLPTLMLAFLSFGLAIIGASLLLVGLILVYPLITMIWVVAYLMMTRQPIQRPMQPSLA